MLINIHPLFWSKTLHPHTSEQLSWWILNYRISAAFSFGYLRKQEVITISRRYLPSWTTVKTPLWNKAVLINFWVHFVHFFLDATESGECYSDPRGKDYRGVVTWTNGGSHGVARRCNNWENQSPHKHTMTPSNRPGTGLGMHSYCRNPDNMSGGPWCYTTDSSIRWQYCNVGDPKPCPGAGKLI